MDDFISRTAASTHCDEDQVRSFVGQILEFIKKKHDDDSSASDDIIAKIPGADQLLTRDVVVDDDVTKPAVSDNEMLKPCMPVLNMMKEWMEKLLLMTGGGDAAQLTSIVNKSGVSVDQGASIIQELLDFMKLKVGPDTVNKITEQIPALVQTTAA